MRKYIVNVVEKRITPFVVEAESEWEAIEKASDGDGYIHQSGSFDLSLDPGSWEVEDYHNEYPQYAYELLKEYV